MAGFERACESVEKEGYEVFQGKNVRNRRGYLAGTEAERAEDLIHALSDPGFSAVISVRGGYGSSRLLPFLPFSAIARNSRIFLGHSDLTFLHLAFRARMRWVTFHGPNFIAMNESPGVLAEVLNALAGRTDFCWPFQEEQVLKHGTASGVLTGGNLTCFVHTIGTPYFPNLEGSLLMVEDCGEALYRLDRLFTHLKLSGVLDRISGLILGQFTDCGEQDKIWEMVLSQTESFHFPVICNLPFGHGSENKVIPFGISYQINSHEHIFKALESPFRR
jgi:muramoyltetrapeptide carboxypeptidase